MMRILLSLLVIGLVGCNPMLHRKIEKPSIRIESLEVVSLSFTDVQLKITTAVENPNDFELKAENIKYQLLLSDDLVAQGEMVESTILPPLQIVKIDIPLKVKMKLAQKQLLNLVHGQNIPYEASGSADVSIFTIPFKKNGLLGKNVQE